MAGKWNKFNQLSVEELNAYYKMATTVEEIASNDIKAIPMTANQTVETPLIVRWKNAVAVKRKVLARYDEILAGIVKEN